MQRRWRFVLITFTTTKEYITDSFVTCFVGHNTAYECFMQQGLLNMPHEA